VPSMSSGFGGVHVPIPFRSIAVVAALFGVTEARSQTIKSAVYIDLENYVSAPPTYSGLSCGGNCNTIALKLCNGIGYKYGAPVRMINSEMGGAVCFDTTGTSFVIEGGVLVVGDKQRR
jgi:hypothetical protein